METSMRAELPSLPIRLGLAGERHDHARFATCIRMARAALGWSQHDLAHMLGMTQRSVNRIELGHCEPRRSTTLAIETVLRNAGLKVAFGFDGSISVTVAAAPQMERRDRRGETGRATDISRRRPILVDA